MSKYSSAGGLDDASLVDGDRGFIGINQRDSPNQLREGEITLSKNGRIDGCWQPRKGIELKSGQLSSTQRPLRLPFWLLDSPLAIDSAVRSGDVVTLTLTGGVSNGANPAYLTIGDPISGINPLTGTDDVLPGSYLMTAISETELTFESEGADETLAVDGTYGAVHALIDDNAVSDIYGSCKFSDPSSQLRESIVFATNIRAKRVNLSDYTVNDIEYPNGETVNGEVDMIQAFDRVYLFREGEQPWEWLPQGRLVTSSNYTSATGVVELVVKDHGLTVGDGITVSDIGFATTDPNGEHVVSAVTDVDTFEYVIATGGGDETYTASTGKVISNGFTLAAAGAFTQPQTFTLNGDEYGVSNNIVRFTVAGNTTIETGDFIRVENTDIALLAPLVGNSYRVTEATATDIYFSAPIADVTYASGSASEIIQFSGRFSEGGGFIHAPAPPWAIYFQRRLWCPYFYEPAGTFSAPTYTDRQIRDDIVASDILDGTTFDRVFSQFRVTGGSDDYLVGMHPFNSDNLLIFNRNSIHILKGTQGGLQDTRIDELTREIGCLARKSIVTQGENIFFLSDNGIYGVNFIDEYNLRGVEEPLSKLIQPYINRININLADKSLATYYNNRYYIALPLDSEEGVGDAVGNNTVLVYNLLNKGWESADEYGNVAFNITAFHIAQSERKNDLYIVNQFGGVHLADSLNAPKDVFSVDLTAIAREAGIDYELQTRGYDFQTLDRKKYRRGQVQMQSAPDDASDVEFRFLSEDPDTSDFKVSDIASLLNTHIGLPGQLPSNETGNFRFNLGNPRGVYGILTIRRKILGSQAIGRPKITSVAMEATITNRQTLTQY